MTDEKTNDKPSGASGGSVAAGIRRCIAEYEQIAWGWDGDCGANDIISRIEEECDRIDAARPAPTLTDAEREAVAWAVQLARYSLGQAERYDALCGLLERTK